MIINLKPKTQNIKQIQIEKIQSPKTYNLNQRTLNFAKAVRDYVKELPRNLSNLEYGRQLIRASSSVGANYIEAEQALGKKDFTMRIKISRKEAKESGYWLELTETNDGQVHLKQDLVKESLELTKIFGAVVGKSR